MLVRQKEHEILELKSAAMSVGAVDYAKDRVTTSSAGDAAFASQVERWLEWEREAIGIRARYVETMRTIQAQIDALDKTEHIEILMRHYVEGQPFWAIAESMHYSYKHIIRLHVAALRAFAAKHKDAVDCGF